MREIVICAAVISKTGKIYRGHRHSDALRTLAEHTGEVPDLWSQSQGFITSKNRYVDRKEAFNLQKLAGIKSVAPEGYDKRGELFSEDLY